MPSSPVSSVRSRLQSDVPNVCRRSSLFHQDMVRLWRDKGSADVIFIVGDSKTEMFAHSLILQFRCPAFATGRMESSESYGEDGKRRIHIPDFDAATFSYLMEFLYTGTLPVMSPVAIPQLLCLSDALETEDLEEMLEEEIAKSLGLEFCLELAASVKDAVTVKSVVRTLNKCYNYISDHFAEMLKHPGFLRLSHAAVTSLISSDKLVVSDEELFRAAMTWAKHSTGISNPITTDEKYQVDSLTSQILEHACQRFEVCRSSNPVPSIDALNPRSRVALQSFSDSRIIQDDSRGYIRLLLQWAGPHWEDSTWSLVFRASAFDFSARAFHKYCDDVAPTYVLIRGHNGSICGGFSDIPWGRQSQSKGRYTLSNSAFLFTLENALGRPPTRFEVTKKAFAVAHHPDFGPIFGAGADLCLSDACHLNAESYSNLPHSYDGTGASYSLLMGDYNFAVDEYEVFAPAQRK